MLISKDQPCPTSSGLYQLSMIQAGQKHIVIIIADADKDIMYSCAGLQELYKTSQAG